LFYRENQQCRTARESHEQIPVESKVADDFLLTIRSQNFAQNFANQYEDPPQHPKPRQRPLEPTYLGGFFAGSEGLLEQLGWTLNGYLEQNVY
jgi:hypothetical protein